MAKIQKTKEEILQTASHLFAHKGYGAVSMRDLAKDVGVTAASLYYHFSNKDVLIEETLVYVFRGGMRPLEQIVREAKTQEDKLKAFIKWAMHIMFENEVFARLFVREGLDPNMDRRMRLIRDVFEKPLSELVEIVHANTKSPHPIWDTMMLVSLTLGLFQMAEPFCCAVGSDMVQSDPDILAQHVTEFVFAAFAAQRCA